MWPVATLLGSKHQWVIWWLEAYLNFYLNVLKYLAAATKIKIYPAGGVSGHLIFVTYGSPVSSRFTGSPGSTSNSAEVVVLVCVCFLFLPQNLTVAPIIL